MTGVTVHFATNRNEIFDARGNIVDFGSETNSKSHVWLRFGAADMVKKGNGYRLADLRVEPEKVYGVDDDNESKEVLGSTAVFDGLRARLKTKPNPDLLLLLHGYACTFQNALSNAAELKSQWSVAGKPLEVAVFSWPSDGKLTPMLAYASDRDDGRESAKAVSRTLTKLVEYLRHLRKEERCEQELHLVAHSMGNYVLRHALQALTPDIGARRLPRILKNIFLMAADEDNDAFEDEEKLMRLPELAEAVHVYLARNDTALSISDITKGNPDRLGWTGPRTLTNLPSKVTLVDCTDVAETGATDGCHQYYRKRAEVIADIRQVLAGKKPEEISGRKWIPSTSCFRIASSTQRRYKKG